MIKAKRRSRRSLSENAYYWGCIIDKICLFRNWAPYYAHIWIKDTWRIKSTAELDTKEFEDLMDMIREHCKKHWGLELEKPKQ